MYVPIPSNLKLKKSNHSQNKGLFAKEFIPKGTNIGVTHVMYGKKINVSKDNNIWEGHGILYSAVINNTRTLSFEDNVIHTPLGGFLNQGSNGNCGLKRIQDIWMLLTIKDIQKESELFVTTIPSFQTL